jgi:tetratricopeptide (TPR) repeat protein
MRRVLLAASRVLAAEAALALSTGAILLAATRLHAAPLSPAPQATPAAAATELPAAIQAEVQAAQDALARGVAEFDGPQQSRSIVVFDQVIARLEALGARALPPRGRDVLAQAYEYRGRAYYGIGLSEKAAENFRQLVQLKPDHALSKERVSPKIVELFDSVKRTLVGRIAVSSDPAGASVTLVSPGGLRTDLGLTDFFPIEVLAGEYAVEVARAGYKTETRPVSIAAEATETLAVPLTRVLASAFFVVEPAGVEIWVDGELRATTSGSLAPELHEAARARGLDPLRAAARVEIPNLSLGNHAIELRRRCYEGVKRTLETPEPRDYELDAIRLTDSLATLKLTSDPPGARILLNGEARGVTPAEITGICSGKVRVEVKHEAGKFIKDLTLEKDEALSLDCPIRPTLAFLGVEAASAAGLRYLADADERIQQNLDRLASLNFIAAPREAVDRMLEQEKLTRQSLLPGSGTDPDLVRKVTDRLGTSLEVQGFLVAVLPEERLQRTARLYLLAAGNTRAEAVDVTFADAPAYAPLLKRLDAVFASERPWSGLVTVDTLTHEGVPVLRVVPGSPAEKAGIGAGDLVQGADGQPVRKTADLLAAALARKPGDKLVLHVKAAAPGSQARGVELVLGSSAREIPLFDPQLVYNKAMMDLRAIVEGYPGTEAAAYARLNLAICAMHFGDYAGAHDYLQKAKAELPLRPGLSRGTALYYLGLALDKLGYRPQAVEAYRAAADVKDATLIDNDGPGVAALAARRAGP